MSEPRLRIQTYRSFEQAEALRPAWDLLALDNFMLSWTWLSTWWQEMASKAHEPRSLVLVTLLDEAGELCGIAPLYRSRHLSARSLRFLGDGDTCSDYVRLLCRDGFEFPVYMHLARWIAEGEFSRRFGTVDWIEVEGYLHGHRGWIAFWNELARYGWSRHDRGCEGSWVVSLTDDVEAFHAGLPKRMKRKYKKAIKRLDDVEFGASLITDPAEIEHAWPDFVRLHQLRRKSLDQPGCFSNEKFAKFLHRATLQLARDGVVHLARITWRGEPIAYLLMFRSSDRVAVYQSGLHPEFEHFEPGHLINTFALRCAVNQRFRKYDFLRGDEPYKSQWNSIQVPLAKTRCVSPRMVSQLKNNLWTAGRVIKAWSAASSPAPVPAASASLND